MNGKHTPTPWVKSPDKYDWVVEADGVVVADCYGSWNSSGEVTPAEAKSNAALIVRAANAHDALVTALEECTERFRKCLVSSGCGSEYADIAVEKYHAELALARGDAP